MISDFLLAGAHHLLAFTLLAVIFAERVLLKDDITPRDLRTLGSFDRAYGITALLLIIVGIARVIWGAKGHDYYLHNDFFWLKMAAFATVGLISIPPTLRFIGWSKQLRADANFRPAADDIARLRRYLTAELLVFIIIPVCAAAMARGFGF